MDPPVWEPRAPAHMEVATATDEPLLEPPGVWAWFHGLRVGRRVGGGELGSHGLAQHDGPGFLELGDDGSVVVGHEVGVRGESRQWSSCLRYRRCP